MLKKSLWILAILALLSAVAVYAQQRSDDIRAGNIGTGAIVDANAAIRPGSYWLGVWCSQVPPAMRSHLTLPEKQGLLVQGVAPNSPAAKAGVAQYDILLQAGDKPLVDPRDLIAAVETAKETKLKIDLLHAGKPKTVEITPAKRPEDAGKGEPGTWASDDRETMEKWLQGVWPEGAAADHGKHPLRFRFVHPGAIVPRDIIGATPLPPNTSVVISKEGDQPIKIVVKQGDKKWEVTEKELDKLPADIRPHVERLLGRGPLGVVGGLSAFDFVPEVDSPNAEGAPMPPLDGRLEKRLNEMNHRIDKMMKAMEEMMGDRDHRDSPEKK